MVFRRELGSWLMLLARAGYVARGVVYCLIGGLALLTALGASRHAVGMKGALLALIDEPLGQLLLIFLGLGFTGFAVWCLEQALFDSEQCGRSVAGLLQRAGKLGTAALHLGVVATVGRLLVGSSSSHLRDWSAWLLGYEFGPLVLGTVALGVLAFGLGQAYRGLYAKLESRLRLDSLGPRSRRSLIEIARFGLLIHGLVFILIGTLLMASALRADPYETKGIGGALAALQRQAYGRWLLALVAAGLTAFGLYQLLLARYRRITTAPDKL